MFDEGKSLLSVETEERRITREVRVIAGRQYHSLHRWKPTHQRGDLLMMAILPVIGHDVIFNIWVLIRQFIEIFEMGPYRVLHAREVCQRREFDLVAGGS
jgi:hypothetical protein